MAGFPARTDGRISREVYFLQRAGSGDFAGNRCNPISRQFDDVVKVMEKKWQADQYIAYFQAFTNTYDTVDNLRQKYDEAIRHQGVVALAIATRPDCIDEPVARLLAEYSRRVYTWVELGLQTSNEATGRLINRGYDNLAYEKAMALLTSYDIPVVTHIIFGLPGETHEDMLRSVKYVNAFKPAGIKLHLLHLMKHPHGQLSGGEAALPRIRGIRGVGRPSPDLDPPGCGDPPSHG